MDLDCKDGTCPIDGNKGKQTIRSGKSCLPCSGYKRYSTSNGFGKDSSSSGRLPRDEKKASIGTGSGTIRKDATTPSLPPPRGDVFVPERTTGPTGTTVGANGNPKHDVIRVGEGKGVVTGAATDGGASRPVSMPTANISGGTADAIGGTPARSGRASKGAIVTPAITDAVTTSSVIRTAAPTIPVVRMPSSSSITGLNIPKGVGREISINLPPSVSAKQPSPSGDVVTPKQAAPFVLAPIAPLATQQPRPDYCDATGMNELIACQRGSDGTFPAVSSACAQSFRDLLARGLSVAEIISGNELCSDEFRRLLAGATPVLIEPPKQGAPVAAAKGMPLAVAAPTMIVAPGGAPTAVNPVQCMAMFLALPSAAQAAIVGAYPCPMARSLAPEIARGSRAAAADFVQWFGSAFGPASAEVRSFCAAVLNARGVAAAGAPGGIVVHGRAYVQPAGAAKGGMGAAIQSPRGYQGVPDVDRAYYFAEPFSIANMPPWGSVIVDGQVVSNDTDHWDRNVPTTWNVGISGDGRRHHVVLRSPSGEQRDAGYLTFSGPIMIDWNALRSVSPLTSPGSTGTAVYNAKAAGAPGGKSMVLRGPREFAPPPSVPVSKGGYEGTEEVDSAQIGALGYPITIFGMPYFGRVLVDGREVGGQWIGPQAWQVRAPVGQHDVRVFQPNSNRNAMFTVNVSENGAAVINAANASYEIRPVGSRVAVAPGGAPGGIVVHGRAYVQPAGAAKGGASMVLAGPRVSTNRIDITSQQRGADYFAEPFSIANMPPWGTVIVDGQVVSNDTDHWDRNVPTTWNVGISGDGRRHHVVLRSPSGEQRDAGYLTFSGPIMIDWNALHSVKPLTSPGSTGTAAYNAKAAGAPSGKSMVLAGPNARRPVSSVVLPESYIVHGVNTSPSSVAPGAQFPDGMYDSSAAQCLQMLRSIAARDPRAIVAAFHQSGLDGVVPGAGRIAGNATDAALALIDDCAERRQQYPRQFDAFCRIAAALSGVKPGGAPVRPAGGNPPGTDMTFTLEEAQGGSSPYQQCVDMGGVDCERLRAPAAQQPGATGPSASQIIGGIGSIATTGIGVLNSYLDRESAQHIEELRQNASSANERTRQNALIEIERIRAASAERIAALGPNPSPSAVADVLNRTTNPSTSNQPPSQGMSTGTTVALAAGGVAIVGGIAYLALSKKGR